MGRLRMSPPNYGTRILNHFNSIYSIYSIC